MKLKVITLLLCSFFSSLLSTYSHAGPFTDKLSICLVEKTTNADKELLIRWVYGAMSSHPSVKELNSISPQTGEALNKNTANLFVDLVAIRCQSESKKALQYEGNIALTSSFEVLGRVAMEGIMSSPDVSGFMSGLEKHIDAEKLQTVFPKQQ